MSALPIAPVTLSAYPKFGALYQDLCANRVNEDGTSKVDARALKEQEAFAKVGRCEVVRGLCGRIRACMTDL